jgi:hypothetical protein
MNRLAPTVFVPNALALGSAAAFPVPNDAVSGEVALNGAYALLGSRSPFDPRRGAIPAAPR